MRLIGIDFLSLSVARGSLHVVDHKNFDRLVTPFQLELPRSKSHFLQEPTPQTDAIRSIGGRPFDVPTKYRESNRLSSNTCARCLVIFNTNPLGANTELESTMLPAVVEHCRRHCHVPRWAGGALFLLLLSAFSLTVRGQKSELPRFEIASVRLSAPGTVFSQRVTDTRVDLTKNPLRQVLWLAFRLEPPVQTQRLSVPYWTQDLTVDIHAIIPQGSSREQIPEMLKRLLEERFDLRVSVTPRLTDAYELVVGSGGIRMEEVQAANELDKKFETHPEISASDMTFEEFHGLVRVTRTPRGIRRTTERSTYERIFTGRTTQLDATRITMAEFASLLTSNIGRPVFDRTKLTGMYRFKIELPFDASVSSIVARVGTRTVDGTPLNEPVGVSAVKAVEQLGLALEPRRILLDTIVVESINKTPTEN